MLRPGFGKTLPLINDWAIVASLVGGANIYFLFSGPLRVKPLIIKGVPHESGSRALPRDLLPENESMAPRAAR